MIISNISNSSYSFQGKWKIFETKREKEKRIKEEILKKEKEAKLKAEVAKKMAAEKKEAKEKAICGACCALLLAGLVDLVSCDNQTSTSANNYDRRSRNDSYSKKEEEAQNQRIKITDKNGNSYYVTIESEKPSNKNQREYSPLDEDFFEKFPNG